MIAYWMLYALAVGLPVALATSAAAWVLRRHGKPERAVWALGLCLALALPALLLARPLDVVPAPEPATDAAASTRDAGPATGLDGLRRTSVIAVRRADAGFGLDETLLLAWLLASGGLALRWAVSARRLGTRWASWTPRRVDGLDVWLTEASGPAVTGVTRSRILVPRWLLGLPDEQRSLVLLHEAEHVRAKDPWLMSLCRVARILTPWNAVVWMLSSRLLRAVEMDCDRRVLLRSPDVRTYCDTLLAISARQPSRLVGAAAFAEPQVPLQERILAMTTPPRSLSALGITALVGLGALLVLGSCGVPMPTDGNPDPRAGVVDVAGPGVVTIGVTADGRVTVDGASVAMDDVSDRVAGRAEAATEPVVARLEAGRDVPYRHLDAVQKEIVEAGVHRVAFRMSDAAPPDDEVRIVLPELHEPVPVSQRNVLGLEVQPDGAVQARRGEAVQVQTLSPQEVVALWRRDVASNPRLIASLRHHPDATYAQVMDVVDALIEANAQRIALSGVAMR